MEGALGKRIEERKKEKLPDARLKHAFTGVLCVGLITGKEKEGRARDVEVQRRSNNVFNVIPCKVQV